MSNDVHEFVVSAAFYDIVSSLMTSTGRSLMRLSPNNIPSLSAALGATPSRYLSTVFSGDHTGLSGDIYLFQYNAPEVENLYGLLVVRGGKDAQQKCIMKTDSFVISADVSRIPHNIGHVCYHENCPNRYQSVSSYESLRNGIQIGKEIDLSSPQLSALCEPIEHGIQSVKHYLATHSAGIQQ